VGAAGIHVRRLALATPALVAGARTPRRVSERAPPAAPNGGRRAAWAECRRRAVARKAGHP